MDHKYIVSLLAQYLEDQLDDDQRKEVEQHLRICRNCATELKEYKVLLNVFNSEKESIPSNAVRELFYKNVDEEKEIFSNRTQTTSRDSTNSGWFKQLVKVAACIALVVGGFYSGSYYQKNKSNTHLSQLLEQNTGFRQIAMLSLMENKSASKRIKGVNYIKEINRPNEKILKALIERMLIDENTNVRLTAAQALTNFTTSSIVRDALVKALKTEKEPIIQIEIIHALVKAQEKKAIEPMKDLLKEEDTPSFVKEQVKSLMPSII